MHVASQHDDTKHAHCWSTHMQSHLAAKSTLLVNPLPHPTHPHPTHTHTQAPPLRTMQSPPSPAACASSAHSSQPLQRLLLGAPPTLTRTNRQ